MEYIAGMPSQRERKRRGIIPRLMTLIHVETLLEAIYAPACIHQLLLAGEERVTLGADFYLELLLGGTRLKRLTAYATDGCLAILGMDFLFHAISPLLRMLVWVRTEPRIKVYHSRFCFASVFWPCMAKCSQNVWWSGSM